MVAELLEGNFILIYEIGKYVMMYMFYDDEYRVKYVVVE